MDSINGQLKAHFSYDQHRVNNPPQVKIEAACRASLRLIMVNICTIITLAIMPWTTTTTITKDGCPLKRHSPPDQWELSHLGWIVALVQINSLLGYNISNCKMRHEDFITKAKFTRDLMGGLICTNDKQEKEVGVDGYSLPNTNGPKTLLHGAPFN